MNHEIEPCPVCGMKAHVEYIHKLERELQDANERARVAEEENGKLIGDRVMLGWLKVEREKRREFEKGLVAWRKKCHERMDEIERLTAEVEEWKKKAESMERGVIAQGALIADLLTLRRSSVRVDVLLRYWRTFRAQWARHHLGANPIELDEAASDRLFTVISRRSSRREGENNG